jgi:rhamnogalacturonan acetylesterase
MKNVLKYLVVFLIIGSFAPKPKPTLYIIGDSTVKNGSGKGADGQWGWGSIIHNYFDTSRIHIENHAIGGRSSRTFINEGRWDIILNKIQPGDYVIMQFGHNDAGAINDTLRARGTLPGIGTQTEEIYNLITKKHEIVHSYGWYIQKYIKDTKTAGAIPIVCSPVPRNVWTSGSLPSDKYASWAAECAKLSQVPFVDLNKIVSEVYQQSTEDQLRLAYFPKDHTHTNYEGALLNAQMLVKELKANKRWKINKYLHNNRAVK